MPECTQELSPARIPEQLFSVPTNCNIKDKENKKRQNFGQVAPLALLKILVRPALFRSAHRVTRVTRQYDSSVVQCIFDGSSVPVDTQTGNDSNGLVQEVQVVSKGLSLVDIGDVHLDERNGRAQQGISDSNRGMCVGAGVDDDETNTLLLCFLDAVDDEPLCVVLVGEQLCVLVLGHLLVGFHLDVF